ncbi:7371_t:CDS:2, partial [Funneliformis geosporum]
IIKHNKFVAIVMKKKEDTYIKNLDEIKLIAQENNTQLQNKVLNSIMPTFQFLNLLMIK